ncbi:MAG: 1-deoxy-D-xylulose-5-phosphate synthase, partial [Oscillospiraceae bacterium]
MAYKHLYHINSPKDIKNMNIKELQELSAELRTKIIDTVSKNGGHLASNLGVVELTIALHKTFDLEQDKIIWDVGHQGYAHKLLTGRKDRFATLRKKGGISGFINPKESKYDTFLAGHSSTSISAALGIAKTNELKGLSVYTISVIGDGALTGGLAFEGLNNAGEGAKNFIVVLNDNSMSINKNQGGIANYLNNIRSSYFYLNLKSETVDILSKVPLLGKLLISFTRAVKNKIKALIYPKTIFENLGFVYLGPVDGNNLKNLMYVFSCAKRIQKPVLVHVKTKKGKGYLPAEMKPETYHNYPNNAAKEPTFSSNFGKCILKLAQNNKRICTLTAAMRDQVGLLEFAKQLPNRFFDVGIAEEHAITFAAGMATNGFIPVVAIYSTFLQRGFDQLVNDIACQNCHVVLAVDRAGFVGEDGETHQGLLDAAFLSTIPNTTIYAPSSYKEQEQCLTWAINGKGICVVRYPKGSEHSAADSFFEPNKEYLWLPQPDKDILLITYGRLFETLVDFPERF